MFRFAPLAMQAHFYVLDVARETEKLIFVTLKNVGYFGLREIIQLSSLPQTATYKLPPPSQVIDPSTCIQKIHPTMIMNSPGYKPPPQVLE